MNLKSIVIVLSVCLNLVFGIVFLNDVKKEGPVEVGLSFKEAVRTENYGSVDRLIAEGRNQHITEDLLIKVNGLMSGGTSYKTYQLLKFDNGEMVLLNLTPNKKFEIQNVVIVPEEQKSIFENE
ncbi:hypothetical protein [Pseudalkalibacillus sp. SCS-8]|uniref:hypothetical protein n=1 Tax=Pseudalkalibacillus nanhaiensis TaxID=3115291 RepID=UPI0032DA319A